MGKNKQINKIKTASCSFTLLHTRTFFFFFFPRQKELIDIQVVVESNFGGVRTSQLKSVSLILCHPEELEIHILRLELQCLEQASHGALYILKHQGSVYHVLPQEISESHLIPCTVSTTLSIK